MGSPGGSAVKNLLASAGDTGSIPGSGRSPGGGLGSPLQFSCLENPMDEETGGLQFAGLQRVMCVCVCACVRARVCDGTHEGAGTDSPPANTGEEGQLLAGTAGEKRLQPGEGLVRPLRQGRKRHASPSKMCISPCSSWSFRSSHNSAIHM